MLDIVIIMHELNCRNSIQTEIRLQENWVVACFSSFNKYSLYDINMVISVGPNVHKKDQWSHEKRNFINILI